MSNNLHKVEKDLRSIAKRYKSIKYSIGLAILFLMLGVGAFSEEVDSSQANGVPTREEIASSKENLKNSVGSLQSKIDSARAENEEGLVGLKLELIQLMEQGNQVVKSPWSSWQFGANYMYSKWDGTYKGRGDKKNETLVTNETKDSLAKYISDSSSTSSKGSQYGTTNLATVEEPDAVVTVNAKIIPVVVDKTNDIEAPNTNLPNLPYFEDRVITVPKIPTVTNPTIQVSGFADFPGRWINGVGGIYSYWRIDNSIGGTDGNLYQTSVEKGDVLKRRGGGTKRIQLKDYEKGHIQVRNINRDIGNEAPQNANINNDVPDFFMTLADIPYSYFGKRARLALINEDNNINGQIFIHFETEGNTADKFDKLKADGHITPEEFDEIRKYTNDTDFKNDQGGELYHVNRGTVELGGVGVRYIQTTFWGGMGKRVNLIENRGNIVSMNYEEGNIKTHSNAIFLYGPDTGGAYTGTQHIYANNKTGKISMYGEKGYLAVFTANAVQLGRGDVSFINDGEVNLYGRNSVGLFITKDARGKLSEKSNFIMNKAINLQGDNSTGLYVENSGDGIKNSRNTARFIIGAKDNATIPAYVPQNAFLNAINSKKAKHNKDDGDENLAEEIVGIYLNNINAELHVKVPQLEIERFAKKSIGIYAKAGEVKATEGNIEIKGGEGNIALYANGGKIDYTGDITVKGSSLTGNKGNKKGIGNMAIFASSPNNYVKVTGNIKMDTRDTVGVYSNNTKVNLNGITDIKLKAGITGKNIGVYAKNSSNASAITLATNKSKIEIDGTDDDGNITNQGVALYTSEGGKIFANGTSLVNGLYMKITNGASAIAVDGNGSNIEAKYSTIDYNGNGYALYAKNGGKIDVSNSRINLYGKSTGFERSGVLSDPFSLTLTGTKIYAYSNNVAIMNLKNVPSLTYSGLASTVFNGYLGGAQVYGANGVKNYKLAVIDGLNSFDINSNFDKSKAIGDSNIGTNDYILTRQLSIRRAKINLKSGKNVKAILSSNEINDIGEKTAVGLATGASASAHSNDETQINLENNSSVTVDRTDKGSGAIGLFINYGKINIANGATVNVEKENNIANEAAVGVYSVNDSITKNSGKINVGGKNSIGILGLSYRIDNNGVAITNDGFGDGKINVTNESTGNISLDGEAAIGMLINNNKTNNYSSDYRGNNLGNINISGDKGIGMFAKSSEIYNNKNININSNQQGIGMFGYKNSLVKNEVTGVINLKSSLFGNKPNIGMYTDNLNTRLENYGSIIGGNNTYGIYGKNIIHQGGKIKLGDNSIGIFSNTKNNNTTVTSTNGEIEVGNNKAIGILVSGSKSSNITNTAKMTIGNNSFGFVLRSNGSTLNSNYTNETKLKNSSVYIYSTDVNGNIFNRTPLKTTGDKNYGIYATGNVTNFANMDLASGIGNIGIFNIRDKNNSTSKAINGQFGLTSQPTITVGKSDIKKEIYSIGMAAGYLDKNGTLVQTGQVENYGKIDVVGENGIGMYAAGRGSKAINHLGGEINLSGQNSIGMYLTDGAIGENYGTIRTAPNNTKDGIIGVAATNGAIIKNYGTIEIKGEGNTGVYLAGGERQGNKPADIENSKGEVIKKLEPTGKKIKGIDIVAPGDGTATIKRNGKVVTPTYIDTMPSNPDEVTVGNTRLNLRNSNLANSHSLTRATSLGMYIDTSGRKFTNPIKGLEKLTNLKRINLIFGSEAARYTSSKNIKIGQNILEPYNKIIPTISKNGKTKFSLNSGSLTWIATGTQNNNGTFNAVYMAKIPYTSFAKDQDTYNFMDGLEQRYGVEGIGTREKELFDKLNEIGKGEPKLFAQAVDEMKGHQYSNIEQRINATSQILDKEFYNLSREWRTASKDSNKIKIFGQKGEYKTETAGVVDYKNYAYGVVYKNENEDIKLGRGTGWYTGIVHNTFKFKDIGNSKEQMLQAKVGLLKSVPFDVNNSLNWTISGDIFVGRNTMHRKFLVVDEIFNAKSRYYTYGIGVKNEIGKEFRLSEGFTLRPYAALKLEYGRVSKIREKSGEVRLEVKHNDYFSVRPEIGAELGFKHYFGMKALRTTLGVAYENELGRVANGKNKARVAHTDADWFNIRGEKENRRGNVKFDLNVGLDNTRYGVTANIGYDTKGENLRGGLGLRVIF